MCLKRIVGKVWTRKRTAWFRCLFYISHRGSDLQRKRKSKWDCAQTGTSASKLQLRQVSTISCFSDTQISIEFALIPKSNTALYFPPHSVSLFPYPIRNRKIISSVTLTLDIGIFFFLEKQKKSRKPSDKATLISLVVPSQISPKYSSILLLIHISMILANIIT